MQILSTWLSLPLGGIEMDARYRLKIRSYEASIAIHTIGHHVPDLTGNLVANRPFHFCHDKLIKKLKIIHQILRLLSTI